MTRSSTSQISVYKVELWAPTILDETTVETKAISAYFSISLYGKTGNISEGLFLPPPPIQCCLEGLRFHQGNFGGKATLIRGRGGQICRGKWFSRSKFSFVPKCLNSFVRDCRFTHFFYWVSKINKFCVICFSNSKTHVAKLKTRSKNFIPNRRC